MFPPEEKTFIEWCLENKYLLKLLDREEPFSLDELKSARQKIWSRNGNMSGYLFADMAELWARREVSNRDECQMYQPIANALGGKVLGFANQPDCVVNGVPVEAKNHGFSNKSLLQLRRYMKQMGGSKGIAAAPSFSIQRPQDVFFLKVVYSRKSSEYIVQNASEAIDWLNFR